MFISSGYDVYCIAVIIRWFMKSLTKLKMKANIVYYKYITGKKNVLPILILVVEL